MEPKTFSSEHNENEVLTLTSETSSSKHRYMTKLQAKFDEYDQIFEQ